MSHRRYRITTEPDGSTTVIRTDLGCLGGFATGVAVFFGVAAIVAVLAGQWSAAGVCLLLCAIFLPNFARRRHQMRASQPKRDGGPHADAGASN
jgi:hypothetical protein